MKRGRPRTVPENARGRSYRLTDDEHRLVRRFILNLRQKKQEGVSYAIDSGSGSTGGGDSSPGSDSSSDTKTFSTVPAET